MSRLTRGLVQIYTGNGKGKTTAALGLALRAVGHGCQVYMIQFMKGSRDYGELQAAEKYLPNLTIVQSGLHTFVSRENPSPADIDLAGQGLAMARKVISEGQYDLVILDEINVALDFKLIEMEKVVQLIKAKPPHVELVLTGRYAPEILLEHADLISEINLVKHPYYHGVTARRGIEY